MKRVFFLILTNIGVLISISILTSVLGLNTYLTDQGIDYGALMAFCAVWGFAGAFISLAISKPMAKWTMGVRLIEENSTNEIERWIYSTVKEQASRSGIGMPEVGIYEGAANAFATGMRKNNALIAVSTGLIQQMNRAQVSAVLAHEVGHVASGDMTLQTLVQGTVNAFTLFLSRVLAFALNAAINKDREGSSGMYHIFVLVFDIVFSIFGAIVVAYVSRRREFAADKFAAGLVGGPAMIGALSSLNRQSGDLPESMAAFGIDSKKTSFFSLFATHPPIEERINALRHG